MKKYTLELFIVFAVILYLLLYLFSSYVSSNHVFGTFKVSPKYLSHPDPGPSYEHIYGEDDFSCTLNIYG